MKIKHWLPIALCCLPGVIIGVLLGVGTSFFGNTRINSMNANSIFLLMMGLACPIGMGLMIWLMNKNMSNQSGHSFSDKKELVSPAQQLADLQAQRQMLEAEIAELTDIVALEVQQEALPANRILTSENTPVSTVQE
jgi:uncharacterized protein YlxW (UPF0749 family)